MRWMIGAAVAVIAVVAGAPATAQTSGEATIYGKGHFKGPSLSFTGPLTRIEPPFKAKSIQISPGSAWEFCTGNTFTGCRRVDKSVEAGVFSVRSARPIAPVISGVAAAPGVGTIAGVAAPSPSLRGFASEFFVAPARGGQRVSLADNKPENMRRAADDFCRSAGWRQSIHARLQDVSGTYVLVDVLCSNDEG